MSDNKRYYWLKLDENFFEDDTIAWLEEQENGKDYVIFYLKLALKSLKDDGQLIRYVGETLIPYDVKALAKLTNTSPDTVAVSMKTFLEIGLVSQLESGEIYLNQIEEMVGSETDVAKRVRKHRAKKALGGGEKQELLQGNTDETKSNTEKEKEKEIEKELDIDKEIDSNNSQQSQKRYADDSQYMKAAVYLFEKIKERLPNKKEPDFQKWADEVRKAVELDGVPIERYKQALDWSQNDDFWQANILSTNKLRKQFDTIYLQMQRDNKQNAPKANDNWDYRKELYGE